MTELPRAQVVRGPIGPAPRQVPRRLVLRLLFGMRNIQLTWIFAIAGIAAALHVQTGRVRYRASTTATVTNVVDTEHADDGDEIYRVYFVLADASGARHTGSFETKEDVVPGAHELQYDPDEPSHARLPVGLGERSVITVVGLAFVTIGLLGFVGGVESGRRALRLLRHGEPTTGRVIEKNKGDDAPDRLTFEYLAAGKSRRHTCDAHARLEDDAEEPMLYDVKNADHAVTLDDLPGTPEIKPDGSLAARPGLGLHVLVLPAVFGVLAVSWLVLLLRS